MYQCVFYFRAKIFRSSGEKKVYCPHGGARGGIGEKGAVVTGVLNYAWKPCLSCGFVG